MTPQWVRDAVFYQIFPDRLARGHVGVEVSQFQPWDDTPNYFAFKGGTLWGVADDLERIRDLGFNALYFTPIFSSPANHRYHTHDYFQVDPILGGEEAFDRLIAKAKKLGIRIVLDGVFNHTGRSFFAFGHILENGLDSPYLDWYEINKDYLRHHGTLNAFPSPHQERTLPAFEAYGYNAWWDLPALPKLNVHNPEVREYLLRVAEYWVEKGIDGWRLDVPTEITAPHFWEDFRTRVKAINPDCYIVGEIWYQAPEFLKGDRFDGLMNYPLGTASMAYFLRRLDRQLAEKSAFRGFPDVHDAESFMNCVRGILDYAGPDIQFSQLNLFTSHDTPRLQDLGSFEIQDCLQALTFLLCLPGAPCIYYGEELALHGGHDPLCRGGLPEELKKDPPPFTMALRQVIHLRNRLKALRQGHVEFGRESHWPDRSFYFDRIEESGTARVFVNGSSSTVDLRDVLQAGNKRSSFRQMTLISGIKVLDVEVGHFLAAAKGHESEKIPSHSTAILY